MKMQILTALLRSLSCATSVICRNSFLHMEPLGIKDIIYNKKIFKYDEVISADKVLAMCNSLSEEDFSTIIEFQIKNQNKGGEDIFARPYLLLGRNISASTKELNIIVANPVTSTPHVNYMACSRRNNFSSIYFECRDVEKYIKKYVYRAMILAKNKRNSSADLNRWQETIEYGTRVLVDLFTGKLPPLTLKEARKMVDVNRRAFEAWWGNVPNEFKANSKHSSKKDN